MHAPSFLNSLNHGSFLVTIMGLVVPWSFTLAMIDVYSVVVGCPLRVPGVMAIVVAGDWVCTTVASPAPVPTTWLISHL
jgi:hypothetical protein